MVCKQTKYSLKFLPELRCGSTVENLWCVQFYTASWHAELPPYWYTQPEKADKVVCNVLNCVVNFPTYQTISVNGVKLGLTLS